jgi:hypothetical protein
MNIFKDLIKHNLTANATQIAQQIAPQMTIEQFVQSVSVRLTSITVNRL